MSFTVSFTEDVDPAPDLLGGKGAGLVRMTRDGLRVPPGYVISTDACRRYLASGALPEGLDAEVAARLSALEAAAGKTFGDGPHPLLVSVRSGAPVSMPGMMDTVLNLGLSRAAAVALAAEIGSSAVVAGLVARFHAMYSEIVLGALDERPRVDALVAAVDASDDAGEVYDRVWDACEEAVLDELGESVPADPHAQLRGAVEAVFRSWNTRRARTYREHHGISHEMGTAVVVQSMVLGSLGTDSGSGVVFSRNPITGEPGLYGEYLANSQGEDVVAGTRTPDPVTEALPPDLLAELAGHCAELEHRAGDVLDVEFTVERSVLYFLQVRSAKRTPEAAVRIAADLHSSGGVSLAHALSLVTGEQLRQAQRPGFDPAAVATARSEGRVVTTGIGACPGQVSGSLVLDPDRAKERASTGEPVILARPVTSPADLHGMIAALGIVTATGGSTSHAAVVARALGTACVVGAGALSLSSDSLSAGDRVLHEGEPVSLDGSSGELFAGTLAATTPAGASDAMASLLGAARDVAGCSVLARVTLPGDVELARSAGAHGLVTAVDDVLAATGHLGGLVEALVGTGLDGAEARAALDDLRDAVARETAPLLAAAVASSVDDLDVRAMDLIADESRELLQQTAVTTRHPRLSVPLGVPDLLVAQRAGLADAASATGYGGRLRLAVRHVSDPAEAQALQHLDGSGPGVGVYLTSPRAVASAPAIAARSDGVWLELRTLQAAMFGIPARHLLTAEPLDDYVRRGLLSTDPRRAIDASVVPLLETPARVATPVGVRITGTASDEVCATLHTLGFRRFAVDLGEVRPILLGLGRAALAS